MNSKANYRPDIDGLRAIAVLSVIFYHAGIRYFSGGYIGVDIFFVISGFLITGIIVKEIRSNVFSIARFYEQRVRRIFPAVFTVSIFILVVSAFLYSSDNYKDIGQSAIATALFFSNLFFWNQSGYFDAPPILKPFLHMWSLSIEEQFYIFFPLLLILIHRYLKSKYKLTIIGIALLSLTANLIILPVEQKSAFYFMHLRAWELLTGSLILFVPPPSEFKTHIQNLLSITGVGLILASVLLYTQDTLFPGLAAVVPVAGTALLIYFGSNSNMISRLLGTRPMVFIGQISYSLYLWHWPILVMCKYYLIRQPTSVEITLMLLVIILVSALSWKFIENPFRYGKNLTRTNVFSSAAAGVILLLAMGSLIYINNGFPQRFSASGYSGMTTDKSKWANKNYCLFNARKKNSIKAVLCTIGDQSKKPSYLLWGDSHARALAPGLDKSSVSFKISGYLSAMPSCPPTLGIDISNDAKQTCSRHNDKVLNYIQENSNIRTIFIASRWASFAEGTRYKNENGATEARIDTWTNQELPRSVLLETGLKRTVSKLIEAGRNVVIVADVPEIGYDVPSSYAIALRTNRDLNKIIAPTFQEYAERNLIPNSLFTSIQSDSKVQVIHPSDILCDKDLCYVIIDNQPLYRDDDHLSTFGSLYISNIFDPIFKELIKK